MRNRAFVFALGPLFALTLLLLVELCQPGFSDAYAAWPLVISLVFLGMPHGALDFALSKFVDPEASRSVPASHFLGYVGVMLVSLVVFMVFPLLAVTVFLVTTAVHFGLADARSLFQQVTPHKPRMFALGRGALIVSLPFVFHSEVSVRFFDEVVGLVGGRFPVPGEVAYRLAACISICGIAVEAVMLSKLCSPATALRGCCETVVIVLSFAFLNPIFCIGAYLVCWHSWRHMNVVGLQLLSKDGDRQNAATPLVALVELHLLSLPLMVPTAAIYCCLAWVCLDVWTSEALAALTVAFYAVVTAPHHLLVERFVALARSPVSTAKLS